MRLSPNGSGSVASALGLALGWGLALFAGAAQAAIYTCTDASGRRITSDRPIPDCLNRNQDVRNADGSIRTVVPPTPTADERTAAEEVLRRHQAVEAARKDAVRHDRNLLNRYPDAAAHQRAREATLDPSRQALKSTEKRLTELQREHKVIDDEAEFYAGKPLPRALKARLDENQTSVTAQQGAARNHEAEMARINARYDEELARLRKLWNGAEPGTLGLPPSLTAAPAGAGEVKPKSTSGASAR